MPNPGPFDHIITEARRWVGNWSFVDIEEVTWKRENGAAGLWWPPHRGNTRACITLGWDQNEDALWHEVFHSVAHNAPLMQHAPEWLEGWCCAFSEVMRQEFVDPPQLEPQGDFQRLYLWPCSLLVNRAMRGRVALRRLWLTCNRHAPGYRPGRFSELFGYDPKTGKTV